MSSTSDDVFGSTSDDVFFFSSTNLMHHGFTAKQSSWILTRLEAGLGEEKFVSFLQLRNAVLPVLQVSFIFACRCVSSLPPGQDTREFNDACVQAYVHVCILPSVWLLCVCKASVRTSVRTRACACGCMLLRVRFGPTVLVQMLLAASVISMLSTPLLSRNATA